MTRNSSEDTEVVFLRRTSTQNPVHAKENPDAASQETCNPIKYVNDGNNMLNLDYQVTMHEKFYHIKCICISKISVTKWTQQESKLVPLPSYCHTLSSNQLDVLTPCPAMLSDSYSIFPYYQLPSIDSFFCR